MSSSLDGQVVLVTGASGNVGWGIATAVAAAGARLILPSRSTDSADQVRQDFPAADVPVVDVGGDDPAPGIRDAIGRAGRLDHVVAPLGRWWQEGDTLDQDPDVLAGLLHTSAVAQHRLVTTVAPALGDADGSYTMITGADGDSPIPGAGLLVVAVRAQWGLSEVLRAETADGPFRINEFRITTRTEREPSRDDVVPADQTGRAVVDLLTSDTRSAIVRFPHGS